jgi:PDZ domain
MKHAAARPRARICSAAMFVVVIAGCATPNPYATHFTRAVRGAPVAAEQVFAAPDAPPQVYHTEDLAKDAYALRENGFGVIGEARFNASRLDDGLAVEQAHVIGATIVLIRSRYSHTVTGSIPYTTYAPPIVVRDRHSASDVYVTVPGQYQTNYVPYAETRNDYVALFWGRLKPGPLGIFYSDLDLDVRQQLERNTGAQVDVVVKGSPAFRANLLPGDVIVAFAGEPVESADALTRALAQHAGQDVTIDVLRKGQARRIALTLNPLASR